jgi:hypothetical protein
MRRALDIDEKSYGPAHPNVAIRLNNLAQLLQATCRDSLKIHASNTVFASESAGCLRELPESHSGDGIEPK